LQSLFPPPIIIHRYDYRKEFTSNMGTTRAWLFRVLVVLCLALLVFAFLQPWWEADVDAGMGGVFHVAIYPYGLDDSEFVGFYPNMPNQGAEVAMPVWFTPVMWVYLGLVIAATLIAVVFLKKNMTIFGRTLNISRWLIGIIGFSFIVVAIAAIVVINMRTAAMNIPLTGHEVVNIGHYAMWSLIMDVNAYIDMGFWLACATGPVLLILALLKNVIIGKSNS
jgi:hypothetical protein